MVGQSPVEKYPAESPRQNGVVHTGGGEEVGVRTYDGIAKLGGR